MVATDVTTGHQYTALPLLYYLEQTDSQGGTRRAMFADAAGTARPFRILRESVHESILNRWA